MNIIWFGNNWLGLKSLERIIDYGASPRCCVLHPPDDQKYGDQLKDVASRDSIDVIAPEKIKTQDFINTVREYEPDLGISVLYGKILPSSVIQLFPDGIVNLHLAYLPYNRGSYPNVWSIVDETPAGVTLHYVEEDVDTGDIISRRKVEKEPIDTGKTLYRKLEITALSLLTETLPDLLEGTVKSEPQPESKGTYHEISDVEAIDKIDLDEEYTARELINRLRARTFHPHKGVYFVENGQRVYCEISLYYDD